MNLSSTSACALAFEQQSTHEKNRISAVFYLMLYSGEKKLLRVLKLQP
jgi:hypothetical protein